MAADTQISSAPQSGMRDFSPAEVRLRDWATSIITGTYERFGFTKIETPALENINLLRRGEGGETCNSFLKCSSAATSSTKC